LFKSKKEVVMKLYVDEQKAAPKGWMAATKPQEAIALLQTGTVDVLNLQSDLNSPKFGSAMDLLNWMKTAILNYGLIPPTIKFHGEDSVQTERLQIEVLKIKNLYRIRGQRY
jgi:hypothetical protein